MMWLPAPNSDVVYKRIRDGGVLLSTADEVYYGLNTVGALIWEHLPPTLTTLDELCAVVAGHYPDVPADTVRVDMEELLDELLAHRLVRAVEDAEHGATQAAAAGQADQAVSPRVD